MTRLCLALDVPTLDRAVSLVSKTNHVFDTYKVGLELFTAHGWSAVTRLKENGAPAVFLDLKLHDIPRTVHRSILAMAGRHVDLLTVHLGGGRNMLTQAQAAASQVGIDLLGVSILTSLDAQDLSEVGISGGLAANVISRCCLAHEVGLYGVVSSPKEATLIKSEVATGLCCVTPGIRFQDDATGDQKRITTPQQAIDAGADMLVIGRSVTQAKDMDIALNRLVTLKASNA